jgi:uncharacterized protein (DUF1810 family)
VVDVVTVLLDLAGPDGGVVDPIEARPVARRQGSAAATPHQSPGTGNHDRMAQPTDLRRFVEAQDSSGTYDRALAELRRGRKRGHWMWFVFPQIAGLGSSPAAQHYAIADLDEARRYLADPVLGRRLRECARAVAELDTTDAVDVLGSIDALKLHSSMTLFALADPDEPVFRAVLDRYFGGALDEGTTSRVRPDR